MAKKKAPLRNLGKQHIKDELVRHFPYLKKQYRDLKKTELKSEEVFAELFGSKEPVNLFKLRAIYEYQK